MPYCPGLISLWAVHIVQGLCAGPRVCLSSKDCISSGLTALLLLGMTNCEDLLSAPFSRFLPSFHFSHLAISQVLTHPSNHPSHNY